MCGRQAAGEESRSLRGVMAVKEKIGLFKQILTDNGKEAAFLLQRRKSQVGKRKTPARSPQDQNGVGKYRGELKVLDTQIDVETNTYVCVRTYIRTCACTFPSSAYCKDTEAVIPQQEEPI